jgi:hypothetical protein
LYWTALLKRFWPPEVVLFLILWLGAIIIGRDRLFGDPGSLWHITVGQRILNSHRFLETDAFSFTHAGEPWIPQSWLCECGLALPHQLDGLNTILAATAALLAGFYTWVAHGLLREGLHPLLAVLLTLLAMLASAYHFHPRPHLLSLVFLGWTFANLCDVEASRAGRAYGFWHSLHTLSEPRMQRSGGSGADRLLRSAACAARTHCANAITYMHAIKP